MQGSRGPVIGEGDLLLAQAADHALGADLMPGIDAPAGATSAPLTGGGPFRTTCRAGRCGRMRFSLHGYGDYPELLALSGLTLAMLAAAPLCLRRAKRRRHRGPDQHTAAGDAAPRRTAPYKWRQESLARGFFFRHHGLDRGDNERLRRLRPGSSRRCRHEANRPFGMMLLILPNGRWVPAAKDRYQLPSCRHAAPLLLTGPGNILRTTVPSSSRTADTKRKFRSQRDVDHVRKVRVGPRTQSHVSDLLLFPRGLS
jgi:hypothetical protein